jgi:hypothetical protein
MRGDKTVRGHLTGAITANLAQHQRSGRHDPIKQPGAALRPPHIAKFANPLEMRHDAPSPAHF